MNLHGQWIAFCTIVRKEVVRFMRIWVQTLLPPVMNQGLYFLIFGGFIGSMLPPIQGVSYMTFILPGLIMMGLIVNAFSNVASSFFSVKFMRSVEEVWVAPVHPLVVVLGYSFGGVLRGLLISLLVFLVAAFFAPPVVAHPLVVLFFLFFTALLFALGGFLNALFATKFDDVSIFPTFVLTPLTYLGGVFYSLQNLPPFWQMVSRFNPIVYIVDGLRYGFLGFSELNVALSAGILLFAVLVLFALNWILLLRGQR